MSTVKRSAKKVKQFSLQCRLVPGYVVLSASLVFERGAA
jgi:hypothetical protein